MQISAHIIFVLFSLLVYAILSHVTHQRRTPTAAIAWVLLILLVPYVALPLFLMFGSRKLLPHSGQYPTRRFDPRSQTLASQPGDTLEPIDVWAGELNASMGMPAPARGGQMQFQFQGAEALDALQSLIDGAVHSIDTSTYVLGQDEQAARIIESLCAASRRGVKVRLLLDAVGCWRVNAQQYRQLLVAGVRVRRYMPLLHNPVRGRSNLRNHRKMLIVDGERLWAGGRNLAGEYFLGNERAPAWLDISFTIQSPIVADACELFKQDWQVGRAVSTRHRAAARRIIQHQRQTSKREVVVQEGAQAGQQVKPECETSADVHAADTLRVDPFAGEKSALGAREESALGSAAGARALASAESVRLPVAENESSAQPVTAENIASARFPGAKRPGVKEALVVPSSLVTQLLPSGPDRFDDTLYSLLMTAAFHARQRILAVTPYFVPDEALLTAWCLAARRGVDVRLLVPAKSNHGLADVARMRALRQLVQVGARVYFHPHMLHAKAVVVDDAMAMAGSLNLDSRSFFLNFEMMVAFYRKQEIGELADWIMQHMERGRIYDGKAPGWLHDMLEGMVRAVAYEL